MILKALIVGLIAANCFILGDSATLEGAVIDPGGDADRILRAVEETGLTIKFIIATHGHFDHNAATAKLKEKLGCDFLLSEKDFAFVKRSKSTAHNWGIEIDQVPDPDRFITEGDILKLGSLELEIINTPGHSPGGISIYIKSEGILFSGDTLFFTSIGRTDFDGGSMSALQNSIKEKLYTLPINTVVYTGHGEQTTIENEKLHNFFVRAD
jgi:glyoxylase-like metal-dependent hydrolase (beta-lactamase superfamily II)